MPSWPSASTGLVAVFAEKKTKTNRNERERRDNDDDFIAFFRVRKKRKINNSRKYARGVLVVQYCLYSRISRVRKRKLLSRILFLLMNVILNRV